MSLKKKNIHTLSTMSAPRPRTEQSRIWWSLSFQSAESSDLSTGQERGWAQLALALLFRYFDFCVFLIYPTQFWRFSQIYALTLFLRNLLYKNGDLFRVIILLSVFSPQDSVLMWLQRTTAGGYTALCGTSARSCRQWGDLQSILSGMCLRHASMMLSL